MTTVVTMCTGTKYPLKYVRALRRQVARHSDAQFIFFTDRLSRIADDDELCESAIQLPGLPGLHGWWWKLWLFSRECHHAIQDRMLWLDLDTVVIGPLGELLDFEKPRFLRDFTRPGILGSGVMQIPQHWGVEIWDHFLPRMEQEMSRPGRPPDWGDQRLIWEGIKAKRSPVDWKDLRLQEAYPGLIKSYKFDGIRENPQLRKGASIVCFSGRPTVSDEVKRGVSWVCEAWGDA